MDSLRMQLLTYDRVLVAFSGGVDSTFLLWAAVDALGKDNVMAVTALSPSYPVSDFEFAKQFTKELGVAHRLIKTQEIEDPNFIKNPPDRCYYCKKHMFTLMRKIAREIQIKTILFGANMDDQEDYRPGHRAADECSVHAPLADAGFSKEDIRVWSKKAGLSTWNKPAAPCLASRIPYTESITEEKLNAIGQAEAFLHEQGFPIVRVRHHGKPEEDFTRLSEKRKIINDHLKELGFTWVTLDLAGFKSGGLNVVIGKE